MGSRHLDPDPGQHGSKAKARALARASPPTCPLRPKAWNPGRIHHSPRPTWSGRQDTGSGREHSTHGGRVTGWPSIPTGSGYPPTTSGRPAATSSWPVTGTCPWRNRGLMFAPVYYPTPVYAQPSFAFTPSISIVGSAVTANLFVQPSTNQYLFGNFYAQNFVSVGITPWFSFTVAPGPPAFL